MLTWFPFILLKLSRNSENSYNDSPALFKYSLFYHHVVFITHHTFTLRQAKWAIPGEGTPTMLGDMDVPPFWPPFLTFWGLNSIFLGYFFSSTNTTTIFWGIRNTNSYKIPFFPRSLWVQFSAASGTPHQFSARVRDSSPPWGRQQNEEYVFV